MRSRRAVAAVCTVLLLVLGGCAADARRAGNDAAAAGASAIAFFLRNSVVLSSSTPAAQLARVKRWLAEPPLADLEQVGQPAFRVLSAYARPRVDIAVWAYGETTAIEGKDGAVGHVCRRFTVDSASRLVVADISCPPGLPEQP